jgi:hypothetical protein
MNSEKEYRQRAKECLQLANEATDLYVKVALTELASEFRNMADGAGADRDWAPTQDAHNRAARKPRRMITLADLPEERRLPTPG